MSGAKYPRLSGAQIWLLRLLARRAERRRGIGLRQRQRPLALSLWRRGLVNIWYRQACDVSPSLQGPYFALSSTGAYLARLFMRG